MSVGESLEKAIIIPLVIKLGPTPNIALARLIASASPKAIINLNATSDLLTRIINSFLGCRSWK